MEKKADGRIWGSQHMDTSREGARKEAKEEQPGRQAQTWGLVKPGRAGQRGRESSPGLKVRGRAKGRTELWVWQRGAEGRAGRLKSGQVVGQLGSSQISVHEGGAG